MRSYNMNIWLVGLALMLLNTHAIANSPDCESNLTDSDGDGWGWENDASCRVVETTYEFSLQALTNPDGAPSAETVLAASEDFGFVKAGNTIQVIKRESNTWNSASLISDTHTDFGCSGDIYGSIAVVGSCSGNLASIYRLSGNDSWVREATIDPQTDDNGIMSVAIHNDVVAIATPIDQYRINQVRNNNGNVTIYRHFSGGNWEFEAQLTGEDMINGFANGAEFVDNQYLVVGRAVSIAGLSCNPDSSASGCVGVNQALVWRNYGGVGIYELHDGGLWEHKTSLLPNSGGTVIYIGDAVAASQNTIAFPGYNTDTGDLVLFSYERTVFNSWQKTQMLTTAANERNFVFDTPEVKLSADGGHLSFSYGRNNHTNSNATIHTFTYDEATGFSAVGSIDNVNQKHAIASDQVIGVQGGSTTAFSRTSDTNAVTPTTSTSSTCVDSDGDGWGWNPITLQSCTPEIESVTSTLTCVDSDGDGWGWNGTASCRVSDTNQTNETTETLACQSSRSDPDEDGWGWENNASCISN